ncbi:Thioredoxin/glutathione peroxidase BtuE [Ralstonia condita]|uniref:Glutathione peroxidase n=1 Tax=Ralstonia condita TaxID=3058600 RepID=A0ABN9ILV7_9RALS|nr:glutathione peroxidase [Ralstonia sp. LMG 7141]MDE2201615.1 glutathione peroxidase [Burkholderiaceae bacterium]CAJ0783348.1 Thioredoxin/glutathione peroxidase BtuE [Ralstonia sp. LMG 7141]
MKFCTPVFITALLVMLSAPVLAATGTTTTAPPPQALQASPATPASCPALLNYTFPRLQDEKPQSLCQYAGKVLLVVNTASYCGFTYQYKGLEALHEHYKNKGLVVLGFPSNDFFQEKSKNKDIADFCYNTYGVVFPMFAKTAVRGSDANPFYQQLAKQTGHAPSWNFNKYLIDRSGHVVAYYSSMTEPSDKDFLAKLDQLLAQ